MGHHRLRCPQTQTLKLLGRVSLPAALGGPGARLRQAAALWPLWEEKTPHHAELVPGLQEGIVDLPFLTSAARPWVSVRAVNGFILGGFCQEQLSRSWSRLLGPPGVDTGGPRPISTGRVRTWLRCHSEPPGDGHHTLGPRLVTLEGTWRMVPWWQWHLSLLLTPHWSERLWPA